MTKAYDRVIQALRDCVAVMNRDLFGLAVIQPELAQAKKALGELDVVDTDFVEWNGQGLPPVGTVCEFKGYQGGRKVWKAAKVVGHDGELVVVNYKGNYFASLPNELLPLLPLRTPEQIAAEEREKAIKDMCEVMGGADDDLDCARRLYDAGYRKTTE